MGPSQFVRIPDSEKRPSSTRTGNYSTRCELNLRNHPSTPCLSFLFLCHVAHIPLPHNTRMFTAMKSSALVSLALATTAAATTHMKEEFTTDPFEGDRWLHSSWKPASDTGEFEWSAGKWPVDADANKGIRTSKDAKFHAISAELDLPIASHTLGKGKSDIVVQFSVKNEDREYSGSESLCCGLRPPRRLRKLLRA